jgi:hypothetical protein
MHVLPFTVFPTVSPSPPPRLLTNAAAHTNTSPVPIGITFNEAVTGLVAAGFTVTGGTVGNVAGSGEANQSIHIRHTWTNVLRRMQSEL